MNNPYYKTKIGRAARTTRGFSLVEVTLAVAVVAIGLLGVLALFPLGMDAVRQAADSTQMMAIAQDAIASNQQLAVNRSFYSSSPLEVIPSATNSVNRSLDGIWYRVDTVVTNDGFSTIEVSGVNMTSRVRIGVYRVAGPASTSGITSTNYYFTEVTRYVP